MKRIAMLTGALCLAAILAGCATAVPVTLKKPPLLNLTGVQSLVVTPLGDQRDGSPADPLKGALYRLSANGSSLNSWERYVSAQVSDRLRQAAIASKAYNVLNASDLLLSMAGGKTLDAVADAVIGGDILWCSITDRDGYEDVKGSDGKITRTYYITREAELQFSYRVIRTKDGMVMGELRKSGKANAKATGPKAYDTITRAEDLLQQIVAGQMSDVSREIAAYTTTEYRVLEKDESKDARMVKADELVKKGMYQDALSIFKAVYAETRNFAAAYNAAEMTEILGDLPGAIAAMDSLAKATGNPKAQKELERMKASLADMQRLAGATK